MVVPWYTGVKILIAKTFSVGQLPSVKNSLTKIDHNKTVMCGYLENKVWKILNVTT